MLNVNAYFYSGFLFLLVLMLVEPWSKITSKIESQVVCFVVVLIHSCLLNFNSNS